MLLHLIKTYIKEYIGILLISITFITSCILGLKKMLIYVNYENQRTILARQITLLEESIQNIKKLKNIGLKKIDKTALELNITDVEALKKILLTLNTDDKFFFYQAFQIKKKCKNERCHKEFFLKGELNIVQKN